MAGTLERGHTHSNLLNKKIKIGVDEIICTLPNRKFQKGITLVALVLTIIVIMILTMVSINIIINKEIVNKAQVATDKYQEYKDLLYVWIGDIVQVINKPLRIKTEQKVVELTFNCLTMEIETLVLGSTKIDYFDTFRSRKGGVA